MLPRIVKCAMLLLVLVIFAPRSGSAQQSNPEMLKAIDLLAQGKAAEAIPVLEKLTVDAPSEDAYFALGNAFVLVGKWDRAVGAFEDGAAKFPLSARLWNGAAVVYERRMDVARAISLYRRAVAIDPTIAFTGGGRYDPDFDAIYIPVVHDHRGANSCLGRLYVYPDKLHYVVYIVASGAGLGNDDSFETPFTNISEIEVDRKRGQQMYDYSLLTMLTNQTSQRRRLAAGEEARVDLKFSFTQAIKGYRGGAWTKQDIKFFFIEPENGDRLLKYLESKDVKSRLRQGGD
ncbi:MAG: tetratricopeptide repeat protein [Acidobacteria bacterium]|nr:tetratricopeptide repeat protein [Acidobacteriota bacterium]MCL5287535.1 tetratricopeptide repeat protein [Acidobacteriota bacterium]